jgi:hypothetical protein
MQYLVNKPLRGCFCGRRESINGTTDDNCFGRLEPENTIPLSRFIVVIITVALILVMAGSPYYNLLAFLSILASVIGFGMNCTYLNLELVRSLRGKRLL